MTPALRVGERARRRYDGLEGDVVAIRGPSVTVAFQLAGRRMHLVFAERELEPLPDAQTRMELP